MNCRGLHCPGCHRGGPGGAITALLVLLAASAATRLLPILLHALIVTAITAGEAAVAAVAVLLVVRWAARSDRRPARPPLRSTSADAIQAEASDRRELSALPGRRSLPAPAALPNGAAPATPHQVGERTPPA
jgi:hypothetical protein